jgi:diadenosine tetraphosphate (Ap4A) HIT family hydrolase
MSKACPFCENPDVEVRVLAENAEARAFLTNIPVVPGHTLIVPKRCVATREDMTPSEFQAIFDLLDELKPALIAFAGAEGFNYAWNEGAVAGQSVPHFHLHVLPRKAGDTGVLGYEPRNFFYRREGREPEGGEIFADVVAGIRNLMGK